MNPRDNENEATLSILKENSENIILRIENGDVKVGSSLLCDISIPDSGLDEFHFEITENSDRFVIRKNGRSDLRINGKSVYSEMVLTSGDRIEAGSLTFVFKDKIKERSISTAVLSEDISEQEIKKAYLVIKEGENERIFHLPKDRHISIGSSEKSDLTIKDKFVSERHCTIFFENGRYFIRDNFSRNGTQVNGVRTRDAEIKSGSIIRIGKTEMILRIEHSSVNLEMDDSTEFCGIAGFSNQMKQLFALIKKVAPSDIPILITGETGTGKELVARAIYKSSSRSDKIFIPLNCSSISREVLESELFGHTKGSFTGAVANRKGIFEEATDGTVFLDEIGDMPLDLQAKILRTIEYGEIRSVGSNRPITVNTRIISATNKDLDEATKNNQFRDDLFYRLSVIHLHIPPLRERREDIIPIAERFLKRFAPTRELTLTSQAKDKLISYNWPGNVRELKNVMIRAILFARGDKIEDTSIIFQQTGLKDYMDYADRFIKIKPLYQIEQEIITNAMKLYNGDLNSVAEKLDISVSELKEKIKRYGQ